MEFNLYSEAGGEMEIIINAQDQNLPYKLPASQTDIVKGRFGIIYFHHFTSDEFTIWSSVYDIKESTIITGRADQSVLEIHGSIENKVQLSWDGIEQPVQHLDQYNMSYTPHVHNKVKFDAGLRYRTLDVHPKHSLLERFSSSYPVLDNFLNKIENKKARSLTSDNYFINRYMKNSLELMTNYTCNPGVANIFYESKVLEFMIMMLDGITELQNGKMNGPEFTRSQEDKTIAARDHLVEDISKSISVKDLAQMVQLNECILKKIFRKKFGCSIHQYFIRERMKAATEFLREATVPVPEISLKLGYSDTSNFYRDFKREFKITPREWCLLNKISRKY